MDAGRAARGERDIPQVPPIFTCRLPTAVRLFRCNIELVLGEKAKKTHANYSPVPDCPLSKLLELVKCENGATQCDDSGRYLHMVPDPRVQAGFHLKIISKELARALVARLYCGGEEFKSAMAFAMDPTADVGCDAVKSVLFEMLCCRRFTDCVHDGVELTIQTLDVAPFAQAVVLVRVTGDVFETATEGSLDELLEVLEPNDAQDRLALVGILADNPTLDVILDGFTRMRCCLLSFSPSNEDFETGIKADGTADAMVSQAIALRPNMEMTVVVVVPPWLQDVVVQASKRQQSTGARLEKPWCMAMFDPTHTSNCDHQYNYEF